MQMPLSKLWYRRRILIPTLAILTILLILIYFIMIPPSQSDEKSTLPRKLAELFVKTIYYLNYTRIQGERTYYGLSSYRSILTEINDLIKEYKSYMKLYFYNMIFNKSLSSLQRKIWDSYINYYRIANSTRINDKINYKLDKIMPRIKESMDKLKNCSINESLNIYHSIKNDVKYTINLIDKSLNLLLSVNTSKLLNPTHRELVNKTIEYLVNVKKGLVKYIKLMEMIDMNKDVYEKLCYMGHNIPTGGELNDQDIEFGKKIVDILNPPQMGSASDSATAIKNMIQQVLNKHTQKNISGNESEQQNKPAQGAGYYNYTRTD